MPSFKIKAADLKIWTEIRPGLGYEHPLFGMFDDPPRITQCCPRCKAEAINNETALECSKGCGWILTAEDQESFEAGIPACIH